MKDFYDLAVLSNLFEFDGELLARAIRATFERRKTPLPGGLPVALTAEVADDPSKRTQRTAFVRKTGAPMSPSCRPPSRRSFASSSNRSLWPRVGEAGRALATGGPWGYAAIRPACRSRRHRSRTATLQLVPPHADPIHPEPMFQR